MMVVMRPVRACRDALGGDPKAMVELHKWLLFLWVFPGLPVSFVLRESVAWIVALSVYAIITGHWSSWQSGRVEVKQDEAASS